MTTLLRTLVVALAVIAFNSATAVAQHAGHEHEKPKPGGEKPPASGDATDHSQHHQHSGELPAFIPRVTDEDRRAAFPDVAGHTTHDNRWNYFVLFDQLEWQSNAGGTGVNVDTKAWVGGDRNRFWFRAEGDGEDGRVGEAETHVLLGRQIFRWWDLLVGVRQDFEPGPSRTWAAFGLQGLAPYWFEIELTGYVGAEGRTHLRGEVEYELLLSNRLVLQPQFEVDLVGKSDPERGIGAGISTTDIGLRMRYEFKREFAPYIGVLWRNKWGKTADFAEVAGESTGGPRFVAGVRLWF
jgi:copper resistance protein B